MAGSSSSPSSSSSSSTSSSRTPSTNALFLATALQVGSAFVLLQASPQLVLEHKKGVSLLFPCATIPPFPLNNYHHPNFEHSSSLTYSLTRSHTFTDSLGRSLSHIHTFTHTFTHSFAHSLSHIHSLIRSPHSHTFTHSFAYSLSHIHTFTDSLTFPWLTRSLTLTLALILLLTLFSRQPGQYSPPSQSGSLTRRSHRSHSQSSSGCFV